MSGNVCSGWGSGGSEMMVRAPKSITNWKMKRKKKQEMRGGKVWIEKFEIRGWINTKTDIDREWTMHKNLTFLMDVFFLLEVSHTNLHSFVSTVKNGKASLKPNVT